MYVRCYIDSIYKTPLELFNSILVLSFHDFLLIRFQSQKTRMSKVENYILHCISAENIQNEKYTLQNAAISSVSVCFRFDKHILI